MVETWSRDICVTQGADLVLGDFLVSYEGPGCGLVTFASGELSPVVSR